MEKLFRDFETGRDVSELMGYLDREVSSHALIEEQILHPAVRAMAEAFEAGAIETLEEHPFTEGLLQELRRIPTGAWQFEAKMKVLMEHVRTHITEQERSLFPVCTRSSAPASSRTWPRR